MKKIFSAKIDPQKIISNDELIRLKGGSEFGDFCCSAYVEGTYPFAGPYASFCWDEVGLVNSWAACWRALGYHVVCNYYFA